MTFEGTFEEGMKRLQELSKELNRDDISLEQSTALYKEAQELGEALHQKLDEAELQIRDLEGEPVSVQLNQGE